MIRTILLILVVILCGCNKHKSDQSYIPTSMVVTAPTSVEYNSTTDFITITITANNRFQDGLFSVIVKMDGVSIQSFQVPILNPGEIYIINHQLLNNTFEPLPVDHEFLIIAPGLIYEPPYFQSFSVEYGPGILPFSG